MRILTGYICREFLKLFLLLLLIFVCLYLIIDLTRITGFVKHQASGRDIFQYFFYKIPLIISQTVAAAVLLATTFTLSSLTKTNEISAMKSAGISIYRIIAPILAVAVIVSVLNFLGNELILPSANKRTEYIRKVKIQKEKPRSIFKNGRIWFRGDKGIIYNIKDIDFKGAALKGVTLYYFNPDFTLTWRLDAPEVLWKDGEWIFCRGCVYTFSEQGIPMTENFVERKVALKETLEDFKQVERDPKTMSFKELRAYITDLKTKGYIISPYLVDLYSKLALPFINLVMAILGTPFALTHNRSGGKALGIALTIAIGFVYWITLAMGLAVGHGGGLPPVIAAWGANIIFACIGFYLLANMSV